MSNFLRASQSSLWRSAARAGQALLAVAIVYAALRREWSSVGGLALFLGASLVFMHLKDPLPPLFDFLFVLAALLNAGGFAFSWYKLLGPYDSVAHGITTFAITLSLGFLLYRERLDAFDKKRWLFVITIAAFGIAIGALWEIAEWSVDQLAATRLAPSLTDTVTDLIVDALGSFAAALLANWGLPGRIARLRQQKSAA